MYPNLRYALYDLTGLDVPAFALVQTYGFFLAFTFVMCAWALSAELKRREQVGLLVGMDEKRLVGAPLSIIDLLTNAILGFVLGFKGIYALLHTDLFTGPDARDYVLSLEHGSWIGGLVVGAFFAFSKWREKQKELQEYPTVETITKHILPHERVSDIIILAAISGIIGAKLLYMTEVKYESLDQWLGDLFSGSGLAVYGGFILAFFVVSWYIRQKNLPWLQMLDACAPAMILGTGLGRLGCHFSGDGDWGTTNEYAKPMAWIPDWLWGYHYPNNVISKGVAMEDCGYPADFGNFCTILPEPAYPTPIFEVLICLAIFALLWRLRHSVVVHGILFSVYLFMTGLQRFFLEFIRLNPEYPYLKIPLSQAQFISIAFMITGLVLTIRLLRQQSRVKAEIAQQKKDGQ